MDTVPLSVVILTKNEAGRIRDCLASVAWAGERLVIDDDSTDDTVRIAESLGATVLRRTMDIEGRHRNWANAQARYEWVLSLDADERVTPELAQEIAGLLRDGAPYETYAIPRRNYLGTRWIRHGGWYPSAQLKLFKKSVFRWEEASVHPRAISDRACGTLQHDLLHYTYRDLRDFVDKMNRHTTLEAQKWIAGGRRVSLGKASWRAVDRFIRAYLTKQGRRDGQLGFILAAMGGMYQWLAWIKSTEPQHAARVEDVVGSFRSLFVDQERYDLPILMSHLCAYRLGSRLAGRGRVLEIGSGAGYGAYYLSQAAAGVVGVDLDEANIAQATRLFHRPNLTFLPMDATRLAFPEGTFDVVCSFQVIEHIEEDRLPIYLQEIARVLAPSGCFVVSTLNLEHNRKGKASYVKPSFHVKEFTPEALHALLTRAFASVELYGLYPRWPYRVCRRLKKWGLDRLGPPAWNPVKRFYAQLSTDDFVLRRTLTNAAIDLVAVCRTTAPAAHNGAGP